MKCFSCAEELPLRATFCPRCGTAVDESSSPTVTSVRPLSGAGSGSGSGGPAAGSGSGAGRGPGSTGPTGGSFGSARTSGEARGGKSFTSSSASRSGTSSGSHFVAGTTLAGRYRIVSLLGKGGMGEVFRAEDLTLNQTVALKFLPVTMHDDETARARFYQEVRLAREIAHPNVCRVFDVGEMEGRLFLTMEYIDGEDLGSLLRRIGRLPSDKALDIARRICAGLAAAHDQRRAASRLETGQHHARWPRPGLHHRFWFGGGFRRFGRGRQCAPDTPAYMAPEQLAGVEVTAAQRHLFAGPGHVRNFHWEKSVRSAVVG